MTIIANPIYDSVFKFLMEDERAAKVLLSALLQQEVHDLKMRRNEYTNLSQTRISLFRIDFSARIKDAAGREQLVLIELQKTWLMTETLRFRQYLGTQYLDMENISSSGSGAGYGLPIISIYILGHKLGDLNEPVVYVRRRYLDYDNRDIVQGVPDPFIESLTHDSIIVQIPYLQGRARNHLERLLSVFDQECRMATDVHFLQINDEGMDKEGRLLVAVHFYDPTPYTLEAKYPAWGHTAPDSLCVDWGGEDHVTHVFGQLKNKFIDRGIPVYIGEFGCVRRGDERGEAFRRYYLEYVCKAAHTYGMAPFYWDNGVNAVGRECSGLFDRRTGDFLTHSKDVVECMRRAVFSQDSAYTLECVYQHAP